MTKSANAFRTISEVAEWLDTPAHVLRFWESKFSQIKPVKRAGGRRYYRPADMQLLGGIKKLLHEDGLTIKGVQKTLREHGVKYVAALSQPLDELTAAEMAESGETISTTQRDNTSDPVQSDPITSPIAAADAEAAVESQDSTDEAQIHLDAPAQPNPTADVVPFDIPADTQALSDSDESAEEDTPVAAGTHLSVEDTDATPQGDLFAGAPDGPAAVPDTATPDAGPHTGPDAGNDMPLVNPADPVDLTASESQEAETDTPAAPDLADTIPIGSDPAPREADLSPGPSSSGPIADETAAPYSAEDAPAPSEPPAVEPQPAGDAETAAPTDVPPPAPQVIAVDVPADPGDDIAAPSGILTQFARLSGPLRADVAFEMAPLRDRLSALAARMGGGTQE